MKYREPPSDHSGMGPHISVCTSSRGCCTVSYGENADFGFVSHTDNARKSPSLSVVLGCSRPTSANQVWLETYGQVGHAIGSGRYHLMIVIRLCGSICSDLAVVYNKQRVHNKRNMTDLRLTQLWALMESFLFCTTRFSLRDYNNIFPMISLSSYYNVGYLLI